MKKMILGLSLFLAAPSTTTNASVQLKWPTQYPSLVNRDKIRTIIDLYDAGLYEVVKAKLRNDGFALSSSEPDYNLNGVSHSGTFKMTRKIEGIRIDNSWDFTTTKANGKTSTKINFWLNTDNYLNTFNNLKADYLAIGAKDMNMPCVFASAICISLSGNLNRGSAGYKEYLDAEFSYMDESYGYNRNGNAFALYGNIKTVKSRTNKPDAMVKRKSNL